MNIWGSANGGACGSLEQVVEQLGGGDNDRHDRVSLARWRGKDEEGHPGLVWVMPRLGSSWHQVIRLARSCRGWGWGLGEVVFPVDEVEDFWKRVFPPGLLQLDRRSLGLRACLQRSRWRASCSGALEVKLSAEHWQASAIRRTHLTRFYSSL